MFALDFFVAMGFPSKWIKRAEGAAAVMLILPPSGCFKFTQFVWESETTFCRDCLI